jgi:hypothetical protein
MLRRFDSDGSKVNTSVNFKKRLHLPTTTDGVYTLQSIISHHGTACHNGHYTAYTRTASGEWMWCNDAAVNVVPATQVFAERNNVYMLFYKHLSMNADCPSEPSPSTGTQVCAYSSSTHTKHCTAEPATAALNPSTDAARAITFSSATEATNTTWR